MIVECLEIQGFKSFRKPTSLSFTRTPGLWLVTGLNKKRPRLGANAVGKSSIWDALCWVRYGKTVRGLKAKNVGSWERQSLTTVSLTFRLEGDQDRYYLTRTWDPNSLSLAKGKADPKTITQQALDELLGVTYQTFLNTTVLGQFGQYFLDLSPTDKMVLMSGILDLDHWEACSKRARQDELAVAGELATLLSDLSEIKGRLKQLKEHRKGLESQQAAYDSNVTRDRKNLDLRQAELAVALKAAKANVDEWAGEVETSEGYVSKAQKRWDSVSDDLHEVQHAVAQLTGTCSTLKRQLQQARDNIPDLDADCPSCGSRVTHKKHVRLQRSLVDPIAKRLAKALSKKDRKHKIAKTVEQSASQYDTGLENAKHGLAAGRRKLREAQEMSDYHTRELKEIRGAQVALTDQTSPFGALLKKNKLSIKDTQSKQTTLKSSVGSLEINQSLANFWVTGFKELRLWCIKQALLQLEVAINNNLSALGLDQWLIGFDVERVSAAGGVIKGFQTMIHSPTTDGWVPWESWSGGEAQRLRIAGAAGLADLINSSSGLATNIEVWDEPTAHLSAEGVEDLLLFYGERARIQNRQVWLVDHRSLRAGEFSGVVTVVKKKSGSVIQEDENR